jgi:putative transposase
MTLPLHPIQFEIGSSPINAPEMKAWQAHRRLVHRRTEAERGRVSVADLYRKHRTSDASIYMWKARFGGMIVGEVMRLKVPGDENARLKRRLADTVLDNAALQDLL